MSASTSPLDTLIDRAGSLYSLPSIAMDVVRMTSGERVDLRELKETIESDPALTAKILRVVNSSLFGLSGEVGNLTQAIALLGARPLRLLVLGFSLPDRLFADLAREQLTRYWSTSLTRAVAARDIAERWYAGRGVSGPVSGDDAFIAALLRGVGSLVLIQQLGEPYLRFLGKTPETGDSLLRLERESLGFDRIELTGALLHSWRLPTPLIEAACLPDGKEPTPVAEVVELAELLTELVVGRRLSALPELLERGSACCGLNRTMVNELVEPLQQRVDSLAEAMRAPVGDHDYAQVLFDAHAQIAVAAEQAVATGLSDDELGELLLAETHELRLSMRSFLAGRGADPVAEPRRERIEGPHQDVKSNSPSDMSAAARERVEDAVRRVADRCRADHTDLSLALVTVGDWWIDQIERQDERRLERAIAAAEAGLDTGRAAKLTLGGPLLAVLLPAVDRRAATAFCQALANQLASQDVPDGETPDSKPAPVVHAGVASVAVVANKFAAATLIEGAARCLDAAHFIKAGGVKSIEVY